MQAPSKSNYLQIKKRLKLKTTPEQDESCLLLERLGMRFLVNYGYQNADNIVMELAQDTECMVRLQ